jgi:hypothetical protein
MKTLLYRPTNLSLTAALLVTCWLVVPQAFAQTAPATNAPVKFRLKASGAASVRVTGGSRGSGNSAVALDVLAPDEVGLTTQEQPSLFWYQSAPSDAKLEVTLIEEKKAKPLIQVRQDRADKPGIQRLKLADHGVKLTPGVEYQFVVALVRDPNHRSTDQVTSGSIKRIEPAAELKNKLSKAGGTGTAAVFAEEGIWYDALSALSDQIERDPQNEALRQTRADLLAQVGLKAGK